MQCCSTTSSVFHPGLTMIVDLHMNESCVGSDNPVTYLRRGGVVACSHVAQLGNSQHRRLLLYHLGRQPLLQR
jgi:hypothetical protein